MKLLRAVFILFISVFGFVACDTDSVEPDIALVQAVNTSNVKAVKYFLSHNSDPNTKDKNGTPLITLATIKHDPSMIKRLIKAGARVDEPNAIGQTALMLASNNDNLASMKVLLSYNANVNALSDGGSTALMYASFQGHDKAVKLLIKNGADVNVVNEYGDTALISASAYQHNDIIEMLRKAGATR